ncbi:hypothetical protein M422DRAFT_263910 [Sphaerobolus stellatus SS14]|uniref:Unplaced genomic scaffold SPHSTscaffold_129, whole genome shotgun sequence n=1 Tax=Sphaerobolus stellatus (strain SS14) TaxID=990650 RepID=A0A0C9UH05_SPHS4|nr:hypothetical protein M422DRAFT_263910 [Sphaerobolus stellatus SS14]
MFGRGLGCIACRALIWEIGCALGLARGRGLLWDPGRTISRAVHSLGMLPEPDPGVLALGFHRLAGLVSALRNWTSEDHRGIGSADLDGGDAFAERGDTARNKRSMRDLGRFIPHDEGNAEVASAIPMLIFRHKDIYPRPKIS